MVAPAAPADEAVLGVSLFKQPGLIIHPVWTAIPAAATRPAELPMGMPGHVPLAPYDKKPYAQHIEALTLADWWAIAFRDSTFVSAQFEVPNEDLVIIMQGRPDRYGPAVVEIRNHEGKVIKRFEREQVPVKMVPR